MPAFAIGNTPSSDISIPFNNSIAVNYTGFTTQAQTAFDYAVSIWNSALVSPIAIKIDATFSNLGAGILGSAGPQTFKVNFTNAPQTNVYYPISLANQLSGSDLNGATGEITASFNSTADWYYGTDGITPFSQYDFVSVVLHEIGHGLGFTGFYGSNGALCCGATFPSIFDTYMEDAGGTKITQLSSDAARSSTFVSNSLYFNGTNANAANGNTRVNLYAPTTFSDGSSIYHLDDTAYSSTSNALMTYSIPNGTARHTIGDVTLGILKDEGWTLQVTAVPFDFTPLPAILIIGMFAGWSAYRRDRQRKSQDKQIQDNVSDQMSDKAEDKTLSHHK
ncbi:MAG: hypothetical protein DCF19_07540 [Pseudanabaena frigida]|uniref:PEP-CTERM sorting domain-containing protein n=1 Tax=Pseudanabaena frigida TaxID=945775 RepID=A0A2W4Y4P5_9CYAN|nr:MAG: hypothetical protein DCF19_07540 [Pseudanabaena frigida]